MQKDTITNQAREDITATLNLALGLIVFCSLIFVFHWNFLFNSFLGPFQLEIGLVESVGIKKFVLIDAPLEPIGLQKSGLELLKNVVGGVETAKFMVTKLEEKLLLVKVDRDYQNGPVKGSIVPLPQKIKGQLSQSSDYYPLMVDCQNNYIHDTDLFMIIAGIVFPFSILLLLIGFVRKGKIVSHKEISKLKKYGEPIAIVEQIVTELSGLSQNYDDSLVYYSRDWVVILSPALKIIPNQDLIGFGKEVHKNGSETFLLWIRGKINTETFPVDNKDLTIIIDRLTSAFPKRFVENTKEFENAWFTNKEEIEKEFDSEK